MTQIKKKAVRYLTPQECVERGYVKFLHDALHVMVPVDEDGNRTEDHPEYKTSVQMQWNITYRTDG